MNGMTPPAVDPETIIDTGNPATADPITPAAEPTIVTTAPVDTPAVDTKDNKDATWSMDPDTGEVTEGEVEDKKVEEPVKDDKVEDKPVETPVEDKTENKTEDPFDITVDFKELDKPVEIPTTEPATDPATPADTGRNFDDVDPTVRPYAKQMSNEAFEAVKNLSARAKQSEEQANAIPKSYFENPDAYKLTPEYSKASTEVQTAQNLIQFVTNQIASGREGNNVNFPVFDPNKGWVTGPLQEFNTNVEMQLQQMHTQLSAQQVNLQREAEQVALRFQERARAFKTSANTFFEQRFGNDIVSSEEQKQAINLLQSQGITETVPVEFVGNLLMVVKKLSDKNKELVKNSSLKQQQDQAEPGIEDAVGDASVSKNGKSDTWSVDEF